jgi:hypothetical protein
MSIGIRRAIEVEFEHCPSSGFEQLKCCFAWRRSHGGENNANRARAVTVMSFG